MTARNRHGYSARYMREHVNPPSSPPAEPHCGSCWKTDKWREQHAHTWECGYIGCPCRKAPTAAPAQRPAHPITDPEDA